LVWKAPPHPVCEPVDTSLTCPCTGFAYGEAGDLDLVRLRDGKEIDRTNLNSFFTDAPEAAAVVQRWAADYEHDFDGFQRPGFARQVALALDGAGDGTSPITIMMAPRLSSISRQKRVRAERAMESWLGFRRETASACLWDRLTSGTTPLFIQKRNGKDCAMRRSHRDAGLAVRRSWG